MIDKDEIELKAKEFEVHTANLERDYVFGWLLSGIYTVSDLKEILVLKGGNCFRKAYFEHTRFSPDLDFSTKQEINPEFLEAELKKVCDFIQEMSGVVVEKDKTVVKEKRQIDKDKKVYQAKIYFRDFYGNADQIIISIRMDVTEFDKIYLPIQSRQLIHPYSDYQHCTTEIKCLKIEEMLGTKLKCLLQRRHTADLYDYVYAIFVNKKLDVDRKEILSVLLKKTIFERSPGSAKGLLLELPFDLLKGYWNKYIVCPQQSVIDFDLVLENFKQDIALVFAGYEIRPYDKSVFFPANLRNPIMEAGSSQTMLEVTYDGVTRLVEPYSLVYKRRQDGVAREYFYVYDTTGGRSSPPGTKTFLAHKIQSMKNTDEKFEARFPIEISRAGEYGDKSYFGSSFGRSRGLSTRKAKRPKKRKSGITYIVQCPYCRKEFRRSTYSTKLNEHKDKYGNKCYGRIGYITRQTYS